MQRGVAVVCVVWVLELSGVVLDNAFEEAKVLEVDGSADACGGVNPRVCKFCGAGGKRGLLTWLLRGRKPNWRYEI